MLRKKQCSWIIFAYTLIGILLVVFVALLAGCEGKIEGAVRTGESSQLLGLRIAVDPLSAQAQSQSSPLTWPDQVRNLKREQGAKESPRFALEAQDASIRPGQSLVSTHRFTGRNWYPVVVTNTGEAAIIVRVWAIERQWWAHGRRMIDQTRIEPHARQGFPVRDLGEKGEWYLDVVADGEGPVSFSGYVV